MAANDRSTRPGPFHRDDDGGDDYCGDNDNSDGNIFPPKSIVQRLFHHGRRVVDWLIIRSLSAKPTVGVMLTDEYSSNYDDDHDDN